MYVFAACAPARLPVGAKLAKRKLRLLASPLVEVLLCVHCTLKLCVGGGEAWVGEGNSFFISQASPESRRR